MENEKTRINNPWRYVTMFPMGAKIRVGIPAESVDSNLLQKIGFSFPLILGEKMLPDARFNKITFENSEGKRVVRKDLPKEIRERYWEWSWDDWGGNHYSDYRFIPYYRYVRDILPPEIIELTIAQASTGALWIVTDEIELQQNQESRLKLAFNLILSLFRDFFVLDSHLHIPIVENKTYSWELLRPGESAKDAIQRVIHERVSPNKQNMYYRNTNLLLTHKPEIIAVGKKGFSGYFAFEYPNSSFVVLESLMPDNATYILGDNWQAISRLSKREVLSCQLHTDRLYHNSKWDQNILKYIP